MRCLWGRVSLVVAMLCGFAAHSEAWAGIGNLWYDGPYVGDSPEAACAPVMARNGWELDHIDMMLSRGEAACKPTYESAMRTWGYYTWTVAFFNGGACAPGYTQLPDGNCEPNRSPERSCAVGHPVLPGTGTKVLNERDDGGSSELPLARSYRSNVLFGGASGTGQWTFNWQRRLDPAMSLSMYAPSVRVLREDGSVLTFRKDATGWVAVGTRDSVQPSYDANGYITDWKYIVASTGMIERYDTAGKLVRVEERNGRSTVLAYNSKNLLSQVKATSGRSLTFAYDSQGRIASVTAPDGVITRYAYNAAGMLSTVTWPDNTTRQYVYEDTRFPTVLTGVIDEAGVRYATYAYDDQSRAIASELTAGTDRYQFQYQPNGHTAVTLPSGMTSTYTFFKQNGVLLPTAVTAPCPTCGGTAQRTDYDTSNNATRKVDYDGSATTYVYDVLGRETQRVIGAGTADAKTFTTEWDSQRWLVTRVASPSRIEAFSYDANGNLLSHSTTPTDDANGSQGLNAAASGGTERIEWVYAANGQVLTATERKGAVPFGTWTFTYDGNGDLLTLTNPSGQTGKIVRYDSAGRVLEAIDTEGFVHKLNYNARGWLTDHRFGSLNIHYDYDVVGQRTAVIGPENSSVRYVYDAAHRLIEIFDSLTIQEPASASALASPFGVRQVQSIDEASSVAMRVRSTLVTGWNAAMNWLKRMFSQLMRSAHAQVGPGSGAGNGYRPPMPVPTGSQSINASPRPEDILDPNVGSRRMPPEMGMLKILMQVQQACSAAVSTVAQVFDRSKPPGDCDPVTHNKLRDDVDDKCKNSGSQRCLGTDSNATLRVKLDMNRACALARTLLMKKCYRGGDDGHKDADMNAWKAVAKCEGFLQ
ncbi:RHS repeat protein [Ralstonia syzygii]|uniref:RHS repeat protein n=2 Tax=Ralstonia syzygii TaxID=28097 RepID=A0ABX7ZDY4_9RALS|nr:RHS repeat protein [Ralstonia syzygii]